MKDVIAFLAILILVLFFPAQFILNQVNYYRIVNAQNIVYSYAQKARYDGGFSESTKNSIRNDLLNRYPGLSGSDIIINADAPVKYNRGAPFDSSAMIYFSVKFPIKNILAMPFLFGLSESDNKKEYEIRGKVMSEVLQP